MKGERKKILMINDHLHFGGGGDAAFQMERNIFEDAGHSVYTFSQSIRSESNNQNNDYVYIESSSKYQRKIKKFIGSFDVGNSLRKVLNEVDPDLIKLHLLSKYPADIYRVLKNYPVLQILHGPNLFCATSWGVLKKDSRECEQGIGLKCYARGCVGLVELPLHMNLSRRAKKYSHQVVDCFFSPSKQLATTATQLGFSPVEYFPLSIDPTFEYAVPTYNDDNVILFVGALVEQKGVDYLIDAMSSIVKMMPNSILKVAGRGVLEAELRDKVKLLGLDHSVIFLGFQDRHSVLELYHEASVVVVPSIWREQFGLVGPEALACGVPCVGSRIGGIPEWLHDGKSGYLVEPRNSKQIEIAVCKLLIDKDLRKKQGEYGREFVLKEYGYEKYKKNILDQIERFSK